ncbi:MAG TPA: tetratricopeptide repeat protein [Candidatus Baltobacteraceae bacterium]|jgi:tetratricopeptide (TPR) repeat protein|nr:tetratricopeptide repeat protein [Candidatus Baltobacteraceae bacterium]
MWRHLFDTLGPIPALAMLGGTGEPATHGYGIIGWSIVTLAILAGFGYRCFTRSDDRRILLVKWAASLVLGILMLLLLLLGLRNPKLLLLFIIPFLILSFIWLPSVVELLLRPLTSAFTGGNDEVEAKPFYFIAAAKRIKGLHQEAIAEVRKQLGKFPGDVDGAMLLATIQAEDLHDLPAAHATINELLEQPDLTPQQTATALHTLADWQLQQGRDAAAARLSLERIALTFPDSQFAHAAEQRIASLDGIAATRDFRENATFAVHPREHDIGLRQNPQSEPATFDPDQMAAQYVNQLEKHPADTSTREKLAVLYAEHFRRLDLAVDQLEQLIAVPDETPKHVARWLNLLATLHVGIGNDEASARNALRRVVEKFPKSAHAEVATLRMANLRNELKSGAVTASKTLGVYEKDVGLKKPAG